MKERGSVRGRKGQEGLSSSGTLAALLLLVVIVIVLIFAFTGAGNYIFGKLKVAPFQSLETVIQSCKISADAGAKADYCSEFKPVTISGVDQFANCDYSTIKNQLGTTMLDCGMTNDAEALGYCQVLFVQGKVDATTKVNGVVCASKTCADLGSAVIGTQTKTGSLMTADACTSPTNKGIVVKSGFSDTITMGQICCVPTV